MKEKPTYTMRETFLSAYTELKSEIDINSSRVAVGSYVVVQLTILYKLRYAGTPPRCFIACFHLSSNGFSKVRSHSIGINFNSVISRLRLRLRLRIVWEHTSDKSNIVLWYHNFPCIYHLSYLSDLLIHTMNIEQESLATDLSVALTTTLTLNNL